MTNNYILIKFKKEQYKLQKELVQLDTKSQYLVFGTVKQTIFSKVYEDKYVKEKEYLLKLLYNKDKNTYLYYSVLSTIQFKFRKLESEYIEKYSNLTLSQRLIIHSNIYYYESMLLYLKQPFVENWFEANEYGYDSEEYLRNYEICYL